MVPKYSDRGEPRWLDVADYMNEVGKAHNGYLRVRMGSDMPQRGGKYLYVSVEFWPHSRPVEKGFQTQVHLMWPNSDFRSMTSALVRLILDLDFKLTTETHKAVVQAHF